MKQLFIFGCNIKDNSEHTLIDETSALLQSNFPSLEELNFHGNPIIDLNEAMPDKDINPEGYESFYTQKIKSKNSKIAILDGN